MLNSALPIAALLVHLVGLSGAQVIHESSNLTISYPESLRGFYQHSEAFFGTPMYGGAVQGKVYDLQLLVQNHQLHFENGDEYTDASGCTSGYDLSEVVDPGVDPILLLIRGNCHFDQKVLYAQEAGAVAAIVADTMDLCYVSSNQVCPPASCDRTCQYGYQPNAYCECFMPGMAGGAHSGAVDIPSFLVPKVTGTQFKDCIAALPNSGCSAGDPLIATLTWDVPDANGRVPYELWSEPDDMMSYRFRDEWTDFVPYFGASVDFSPYFYLANGTALGCGRNRIDCSTSCITSPVDRVSNIYCEPEPTDPVERGVHGKDIVAEVLRSVCIFRSLLPDYSNTYAAAWWKYANLFTRDCAMGEDFSEACSRRQQAAAGINTADVDDCIDKSWGNNPNVPGYNHILHEQLESISYVGIRLIPTVFVNDVQLAGSVSSSTLTNALCSSFAPGSEPRVCDCIKTDPDHLEACISAGGGGDNPAKQGMPGWAVALIVVLLIAVAAIAGFVVFLQRRVERQDDRIGVLYHRMQDDLPETGPAAPLSLNAAGGNTDAGVLDDEDKN